MVWDLMSSQRRTGKQDMSTSKLVAGTIGESKKRGEKVLLTLKARRTQQLTLQKFKVAHVLGGAQRPRMINIARCVIISSRVHIISDRLVER